MSTRETSNSVKKSEVGKSSKEVVNTGGYELVQPKKVQQKERATTSGYQVPETRAIGGYELVKSPAGKKTTVSQNVNVYERPRARPKRDLVFIIAVIVIIAFFVAAIIGVIIAFFVIENRREKLPDLNELCQNLENLPENVDGDCYYHKDKYPMNCIETACSTVAYKLSFDQNQQLQLYFLRIVNITTIPDKTSCAPGRWCYKGLCVETNDVRVKEYDEIQPVDGYWVNTCEERKCIQKSKRQKKIDRLMGKCGKCNENSEKRNVVFGYRYCKPPSYGGSECGSERAMPVHVIKNCPECPVTITNKTHKCYFKNQETGQIEYDKFNGLRCNYTSDIITRTTMFGLCFEGFCVPDNFANQPC